MKKLLLSFLLGTPFFSIAQESYWIKQDSLFKYVQPVASLQLWSAYTIGEKEQLSENGPLERVQDRVNFLTRRARIGFKGKPYKKLSYALTIQYDNLGKDRFGAIRGGTNTGQLGILDAYATWKITKNDIASVTVGYFHPQYSRECITGDLLVNSFDKSPSQTYIRQHINGKSYGRTTGINIGGMTRKNLITIGYNVGIFNNNSTAANDTKYAETSGKYWSPLLVDRVTFSIGDHDMNTYSINYDANNYFNKRKGVTVGFNTTSQGKTDIFSSNGSLGADILLNYKNVNFDAEWNSMYRRVEGNTREMKTYQIRIGYNIIIARKAFFEPSFMVMKFRGNENAEASGEDIMYDAGINWYLNKKNCKLSLHYIKQKGNGDNGYTDEKTFKKGDFIGLGFVLII
ncbi:porin [Chryseosolibacter indicus]|uniref:Porin n=1 Tax=Chryseosolibacter indicus TaxID=2782351 RepID=A0ABS5VPL7_9BACT|nr:porin [Chryseosolibacter indicus]MBT1703375.1 hypothetical protein [Chryseosolibacter indicus]